MQKKHSANNNYPIFISVIMIVFITYFGFKLTEYMKIGIELTSIGEQIQLNYMADALIMIASGCSLFFIIILPSTILHGFLRWGILFFIIFGTLFTGFSSWFTYQAIEITQGKKFEEQIYNIKKLQSSIEKNSEIEEIFHTLVIDQKTGNVNKFKNPTTTPSTNDSKKENSGSPKITKFEADLHILELENLKQRQIQFDIFQNILIILVLFMAGCSAIGLNLKRQFISDNPADH